MNIYDLHCDALLKLQEDRSLNFTDSSNLEVNAERLKKGNVKLQIFAVFIEPEVSADEKFGQALDQIDLFYEKIVKPHPFIKHITQWEQVNELKDGEIGAVLSLEGADAFGNDLGKWRILNYLGVISLGLTWNNANLCADGVGELRGAGLSRLGREVVLLNNSRGILTDVSHLSLQGFWDVMEIADYPVATHSNARGLFEHPRNLNDNQLKALFEAGGLVGVVFNPPFIGNNYNDTSVSEFIEHIAYMLKLGGENSVALGSDFDGIETHVVELSNASEHQNLVKILQDRFGNELTEKICWKNAHRFFEKIKPNGSNSF
ncbi:dipeptidase [Alkalicoccus daliensis]|uniref:Dipeptidase. Metallo peptidase. MEROPS family M19 n=1 Tax=Alkalicoccus daliensis TaxID=745820 RepID=A0A1H0APC5_9BACI|nr:dipeptidase [Alkalicoccus daliensis]SDN35231.1 dipeptidase. Metallo peptidase. MEROPS family M19 [Alkalicoccus daliensis]